MRIGDFVFGSARTRAGKPSFAGKTFIIWPLTATAVSVELGRLTGVGGAAFPIGIAVGLTGAGVDGGRDGLGVVAGATDMCVGDTIGSVVGVCDGMGEGVGGTIVGVIGNAVGVFGTSVGTIIARG